MPTRANYPCTAGQPNFEWIGRGANYHRRIVVDENDVDAPVGQYPMLIFTRRPLSIEPKAQEVGCEFHGSRKLAIIGKNLVPMRVAVDRSSRISKSVRHRRSGFYNRYWIAVE